MKSEGGIPRGDPEIASAGVNGRDVIGFQGRSVRVSKSEPHFGTNSNFIHSMLKSQHVYPYILE